MWVFPGLSFEVLDGMVADELLAWHRRAVERKQLDLSATTNAIVTLMQAMSVR